MDRRASRRSHGRQPLFPSEGARRSAVRSLLAVAGEHVVLFCLVDDHGHVTVLVEPTHVKRVARSLHMTLAAKAAVPVTPAHIQPVEQRTHAEHLFRYALTQVDHHALPSHAALWSGSCFGELVGARATPGWRMNVREALPRFTTATACATVGLAGVPEAADDAALAALGPARIVNAAAEAACAPPALSGRPAEVVAARRAAIALGRAAGCDTAAIAEALAITPRGVTRLEEQAPPAGLVQATRVRLGIELALESQGIAVGRDRAVVLGRRAGRTA